MRKGDIHMKNRVKEYREEKKFTPEYMAKRVGVSTSYYLNIEIGSIVPTIEVAVKIKETLGVDSSKQLFFKG